MKNPPTVKQLIAKLKEMPANAPVYLRSKYTGNTDFCTDYPVHLNGVSEMESTELGNHVTFLF